MRAVALRQGAPLADRLRAIANAIDRCPELARFPDALLATLPPACRLIARRILAQEEEALRFLELPENRAIMAVDAPPRGAAGSWDGEALR